MPEVRESIAATQELISDPAARARREVENATRQFNYALEIVREHVKDPERSFRLRPFHILELHKKALDGIHLLAGTFRNTSISIGGSGHTPPHESMVSEEVYHLCEHVNTNWAREASYLSAYVLWRLNWIHPFADGNGRTARAVSYVVLSVRLDSLLPGAPTIPEQIAADKGPYYRALEAADAAWKGTGGTVDVTELQRLLEGMLARQLLSAAQQAGSPSPTPHDPEQLH